MEARAVSARGLLTPLAVLAPILAAGSLGLRSDRGWAIPLALVVGAAVILLLVAAVPGIQGHCET